MKKGFCDKCHKLKWINKHHIYPKEHFGNKGNTEIVQLCLDCHADIHDILPKEKQEKSFYTELMIKFLAGLTIVCGIFFCILKMLQLW